MGILHVKYTLGEMFKSSENIFLNDVTSSTKVSFIKYKYKLKAERMKSLCRVAPRINVPKWKGY